VKGAEDYMSQESDKVKNDIQIPDLAELWKEMYFATEGDWAKTMKSFISTETFVAMLDKTLEQYLAMSKISRQQMDKFSEKGIVPNKKDIARVAELVISLEEKIDMMEFQFFDNFNKMTDSVIKMVDFQNHFKQELSSLKTELQEINRNIESLKPAHKNEQNEQIEPAAEAPKRKKGGRKKAVEKTTLPDNINGS